jgi:Monodechloroaminopyrrolnitrin synthase PrnB
VCRAHGAAYAYHHYRLVQPFPSAPARQSPLTDDLTSSGPPLETVIAGLQCLCDLRTARDRPGVTTAHISLDTLSRIVDAGWR